MLGRLVYLYLGLLLFGMSIALMLVSRLGSDPWDAFRQCLARWTRLRFGRVVVAVSALVLMLWILPRQRPGMGTVSTVLLVWTRRSRFRSSLGTRACAAPSWSAGSP